MAENETQPDRNRVDNSIHQTDRTRIPKTTSRRRLLHLLGAGGVAGLTGCSGDTGQGPDTATGTPASGEQEGTEKPQLQQSATIAIDSVTPDYAAVWGGVTSYYTNVLEPLVWVSADMEKQPWLAESWERTGKLTFEFTIRDGVTFHNGEPLTADEVIWSTEVTFQEMPWTKIGWQVDTFQKLDDMTVEFTTAREFASFPGAIAHNHLAIQHPDANREQNEVIGTGPYQVKEIKKGQHVKTSAFEDYWRGAPQTDELTFREVADANTRALLLRNNEAQVAFDPPRDQFDSLNGADTTDVTTQLSPSTVWVAIHTEKHPTDDIQLRQALNYAVSQEEIVESVMNGIGQPARGPIASIIPWSAHDDLPKYGPDTEQAEKLVEASAYSGETLEFAVETNEPVGGDLMAQVIQQNASEVGVDIEIMTMESGAFSEAQDAGDGHLFLRSFGTNSVAADYVLSQLFWTGGASPHWYDFGDHFDSLIIEGLGTGDLEEKKEVYGEAQQIIMEEAAILPLYYEEYIVGTSTNIEGLDLRPIPEMSRWTDLRHLKPE